jgi:hypothetical protein
MSGRPGLASARWLHTLSRMKRLLLAAAVAGLWACDRGGQPASQQKQDGDGGAANQVARPQGRVPDPKSPPQDRGSSGGTVELRGDAALYYLYRQHLTNEGAGPQGRYYLSKEGRVFYKDAQDREHTVYPPGEGMRVSRAAADPYRDVRGYAGHQNGRDLRGLASDEQK